MKCTCRAWMFARWFIAYIFMLPYIQRSSSLDYIHAWWCTFFNFSFAWFTAHINSMCRTCDYCILWIRWLGVYKVSYMCICVRCLLHNLKGPRKNHFLIYIFGSWAIRDAWQMCLQQHTHTHTLTNHPPSTIAKLNKTLYGDGKVDTSRLKPDLSWAEKSTQSKSVLYNNKARWVFFCCCYYISEQIVLKEWLVQKQTQLSAWDILLFTSRLRTKRISEKCKFTLWLVEFNCGAKANIHRLVYFMGIRYEFTRWFK